jgi:hypothetical protein
MLNLSVGAARRATVFSPGPLVACLKIRCKKLWNKFHDLEYMAPKKLTCYESDHFKMTILRALQRIKVHANRLIGMALCSIPSKLCRDIEGLVYSLPNTPGESCSWIAIS